MTELDQTPQPKTPDVQLEDALLTGGDKTTPVADAPQEDLLGRIEKLERENQDLKANNKPLTSVELAAALRETQPKPVEPEVDYSMMTNEEFRESLRRDSTATLTETVEELKRVSREEIDKANRESNTKVMAREEFSRRIDTDLLAVFPEAKDSIPIIRDIELKDPSGAYSLGPERLYALVMFEQVKAKRLANKNAPPPGGANPPAEVPDSSNTTPVTGDSMADIVANACSSAETRSDIKI